MNKIKHISYINKLKGASPLLKLMAWNRMPPRQLKSLIQRFSTKEVSSIRNHKPFYVWRVKRLAAVAVFEERFGKGSVPEIFKLRKLPVLDSYYISKGEYIWSEKALSKLSIKYYYLRRS